MKESAPVRATAILLAAGSSSRMRRAGTDLPRKPFLQLHGKSVLERSLLAFEQAESVVSTVLVLHVEDRVAVERLAARSLLGHKLAALVVGGAERTDSVRAGFEALARIEAVTMVHDVARPLVAPARIDQVARAAAEHGAALLAAPVRDTIKRSLDGREVQETLDRSQLWSAHTPQAFRSERLAEMLARAASEGLRATDDAALHERYFGPLRIVEDDASNWKLTTIEDLRLMESWLASEEGA